MNNYQPSVLHTFRMLLVLAWIIIFSYPALWHVFTPDPVLRKYRRWQKINRLVDDKIFPFVDLFHVLSYPIHNAAMRGKKDKIKLLAPETADLNCPDMFNITPLAYATMNADYELMQQFLDSGAVADMRIFDSSTALHQALLNKDEKAALVLLDRGAKADLSDQNGHTAIHLAIKFELKQVFLQALKTDFNLNVPDNDGLTPLDYAIKKNSYEMVTALARGGAQPMFTAASQDFYVSTFLAQWQKTGDFKRSIEFVEENARKFYNSGPDKPMPAEFPVDQRPKAYPAKNGAKNPNEDL
jgi:ankyrin repeat protein